MTAFRTLRPIALVGLLLAACSSPPGLEASQSYRPAKVDLVSKTVRVNGTAPVRAADVDSLARALNDLAPAEAVYARIAIAGPAGQRAATERALRRALTERGVPPTNIFVDAVAATGQAAATEVTLHRYIVTPPTCRNFQLDLNQSSIENPKGVGLGCANERNLSLMVEDPRDLMAGRTTIGPPDQEREGLAMERYRADQIKELLRPERLTTR